MKLTKTIFLLSLFILLGAAILLANSAGPLPRHTAGFREQSCLHCHTSFKLNEGRVIGGVFEIRGAPVTYETGQSYPITVILGQPGQSRWGFEVSVRHVASARQAGQLVPINATTQVKEEAGIQYLEHTSAGTREGTSDGPVEFHFNWVAPDSAGGPVFFNAAGNAADASGTPAGDYIYTAGAYSGIAAGAGKVQITTAMRPKAERNERTSETSKLLDLPSPVDLNKGTLEFHVQHRFFQSISDSTPGNAFGVDYGANINLGVNYAITDHLSAGISRARLDQIVSIGGAYEIRTRKDSPWKMSFLAGVDGKNNFEQQFSPYVQLATSFEYKRVRLNVVPTLIFNSRDDTLVRAAPSIAINPLSNNTFSLGIGGDIVLDRRFSLIGEVVPRLAGFGGFGKNQPQFGGGLAIRTPAHVFTILVSTSREFNVSKYGVNAGSGDVSLGFNIYRRFR
jgi:hypothetical protein